MRPGIKPRAPPGPDVRLSAELKDLIFEAYPDLVTRTDILLSIEIHLGLLNSQSRSEDAAAFLLDCEIGTRTEIRNRTRQKSRGILKLIGNSTLTASVSLVFKYISAKLGIS